MGQLNYLPGKLRLRRSSCTYLVEEKQTCLGPHDSNEGLPHGYVKQVARALSGILWDHGETGRPQDPEIQGRSSMIIIF